MPQKINIKTTKRLDTKYWLQSGKLKENISNEKTIMGTKHIQLKITIREIVQC